MTLKSHLFKRCFTQVFWISLGLLFVALPFAWLQLKHPQHVQSLAAIVSQHIVFFTCIRWILIIGIALTWQTAVIFYSKKRHWLPEKTQFWLGQRARVIGWLILFEIVICQNIFLKLLQLF